MQKKRHLWSVRGRTDFTKLSLEGWAAQRREDMLAVLGLVESQVEKLDRAVEEVAAGDRQAQLLMTQPGVGPVTALAFVVTIGDVRRFPRGKQVASYLGLIPVERSSGDKRRLGSISKQGNMFLRTMLVEAAQSACRYDEGFRREYRHRCHQKPKGVAKVAAARKLAVRLYWMLRTQTPYTPAVHNEGSSSHAVADLR